MNYQLQEGRGGTDWADVEDYPRDSSDLAAWIEIGRDSETFDGKYELRIIDESGQEVWHIVEPYEGVRINLFDPPELWLESIRADYGIEESLFVRACRRWMEEH